MYPSLHFTPADPITMKASAASVSRATKRIAASGLRSERAQDLVGKQLRSKSFWREGLRRWELAEIDFVMQGEDGKIAPRGA